MNLYHHFVAILSEEIDDSLMSPINSVFMNNKNVLLQDDIMLYIEDTLEWIPTLNAKGEHKMGLYLYSVDIIGQQGLVHDMPIRFTIMQRGWHHTKGENRESSGRSRAHEVHKGEELRATRSVCARRGARPNHV